MPQSFRTIGVDDGLTQNSVYGMFQDKRGFLWIVTADGLNRYDGKHIKRFKTAFSANEPYNGNYIRGNIAEDRNENLWYYTENGLYSYNRCLNQIEKKYIPRQPAITRTDFKVVFVDSSQRVWLFNQAFGLASFNIMTGEFKTLPKERDKSLAPFDRDATVEHENIWFGMNRHDGLYRFNTRTSNLDHFFRGEDVGFIRFKSKGYYKVCYDHVVQYDSASGISYELPLRFLPKGFSINSLVEDSFHRLWLATDNHGLFMYDLGTKQTVVFQSQVFNKFSLPTNHLTGLLIDNNQNLWVSTEGAGVCWLDTKPSLFKSSIVIQQEQLNANLFVKAIAEDLDKNIWIASRKNPIYILNLNDGKIKANTKLSSLGIENVSAIAIDSEKNVLLGHGIFLSKVDEKGNLLARGEFHAFPNFNINKVHQLKDGRIIVATSNGVFLFSQKGKKLVSTVVTTTSCNDVLEIDNERLWIGSRNNGAWLFEKSNDSYVQRKIFLDNLDVKSIHIDQENSELVWLATDRGLVRLDLASNISKLYSEVDGMNSSYVYGVLEDNKGRLWCSTNGGIVCFTKAKNSFINFTSKDGLQSNEFNSGAFYHGPSGNLYFGGVKGINWLDPQDIDRDTATANVSITEMKLGEEVMNDSIVSGKGLVLPYFKNDITFQFSVFDFSRPESNKVKYQLKGLDDNPQITSSQTVDYKNIPPGSYTLVFNASTSNNRWSPQQRFEFVIVPPYWQRWWFYVAIVFSVVTLISLVVWYVTRQRYKMKIAELEKQNALELERRRISMEMHDDVGASLTQITLISEAAKHTVEKENALNQIAETSRKVMHSMSEIIWSLNPDNQTFEQLMSYLRDQLHNLLEPSGIDYMIGLPENGTLDLSNATKRTLILIVKEGVNNSLKHAKASRIEVIGRLIGNKLEIEIKDNGVGFEAVNGYAGNGLRNMKARMKEVNGRFELRSSVNSGTELKFEIDLTPNKQYH